MIKVPATCKTLFYYLALDQVDLITIYTYFNKMARIPHKTFENFGQILDEALNHLNLKQIDLTKIYNIDRTSISSDRRTPLTRRKMLKYMNFMKANGISEDFFLRGIYPIVVNVDAETQKTQQTIDELTKELYVMKAVVEEKKLQITQLNNTVEILREALNNCIAKCGDKTG